MRACMHGMRFGVGGWVCSGVCGKVNCNMHLINKKHVACHMFQMHAQLLVSGPVTPPHLMGSLRVTSRKLLPPVPPPPADPPLPPPAPSPPLAACSLSCWISLRLRLRPVPS